MKIRLFDPTTDSLSELNALLRSAYSRLWLQDGLRYNASWETPEDTLANMQKAECYVGISESSECVTTALIRPPGAGHYGPPWYFRPEVTHFGRLAVRPSHQGHGLGRQMLDFLESRARDWSAQGIRELALDTSEKATRLIELYSSRGYRFIENWQWDTTNYRSVVMSLTL